MFGAGAEDFLHDGCEVVEGLGAVAVEAGAVHDRERTGLEGGEVAQDAAGA